MTPAETARAILKTPVEMPALTLNRKQIADLKALATSYDKLLAAAKDVIKNALWEIDSNCAALERLEAEIIEIDPDWKRHE